MLPLANRPALQARHALAPASENVPLAQSSQIPAPSAEENVPLSHVKHVEPPPGEYAPALQIPHSRLPLRFEYWPNGQTRQLDANGSGKLPVSQARQVVHPYPPETVPAGQVTHRAAPATAEKVPVLQGKQFAACFKNQKINF